MEFVFELLALIAASIALGLLIRARSVESLRPAIITLYVCIGLDVAETITRRFLDIKATGESATIETVTIALSATALYYAIRSRKEIKEKSANRLGLAIMCMVWAVTIFALELMLGLILSYFQ
ncbi:MAG: hypothetical protein ACE5KK_04395 [Candidatus Brocadiales bacterium]